MNDTLNSPLIALLVGIINFLSLIIIAGLSWTIKSLWADMKQVRSDVSILQAEHRIYCTTHEFNRRVDDVKP